jgi:hypothetical protein
MAGWLIAAIVLALAAASSGGKKSNGGGNGVVYPSLDSVVAAICVLFNSTHAAASGPTLRADAWRVFGFNSAPANVDALATWNQSLDFAEQLRSGAVVCEDDGVAPFAPSAKICSRSGTPYNAALFNSVAAVQQVMRQLGFNLSGAPTAAEYKQEVKRFQLIARSLALPGHKDAPASAIDGVPGVCTLVDLGIADGMRRQGIWEFKLVTGLGTAPMIPTFTAVPNPKFIPLKAVHKL